MEPHYTPLNLQTMGHGQKKILSLDTVLLLLGVVITCVLAVILFLSIQKRLQVTAPKPAVPVVILPTLVPTITIALPTPTIKFGSASATPAISPVPSATSSAIRPTVSATPSAQPKP